MTRPALRRCVAAAFLLIAGAGAPAQANLHPPALQFSDRLTAIPLSAADASLAIPALRLRLSDDVGASVLRELVLAKGKALIGTDYVYGANREDAVDCSALVQRMFRSAGIQLPRTTREQVRIGSEVAVQDGGRLVAGDLLFYRWGPSGLHVAVYLPGDRLLHASSRHGEVVVSRLNAAWKRRLVAARRLI